MRGVAITGMGIVSALGRGGAAHLEMLAAGKTGLRAQTLFDATGLPESPAGLVEAQHLAPGLPRTEALALTAAKDALGGRRLVGEGVIAVGTTTGGIHESEQHYLKHRGAVTSADREPLRHHPAGRTADRIAQELGLAGERHTFSTACSSSANAIGFAAMQIAAGAPWALAGGVDSLCRITYFGFHSLKLLAPHCRQFDKSLICLSLLEAVGFLWRLAAPRVGLMFQLTVW
ncbi:MAG: beta-ketoacyl synthase N-terminal-like domain-containing protein [Myxococcaceae bacterium]